MNDFSSNDPTLEKGVIEMVTVANEYCLFVENARSMNSVEIFGFFQKIAPLMYLRGTLLPNLEEPDQVVAGHFVTEEQWEGVFNTLRQKFGKDDPFFLVDDSHEIVKASIAENFSDVYQDLKDFIIFFNQNTFTSRLGALTQLRRLFLNRWGLSLINGLSAIHNLQAFQAKEEGELGWEY